MSSWTWEEKFHIYNQPRIIFFITAWKLICYFLVNSYLTIQRSDDKIMNIIVIIGQGKSYHAKKKEKNKQIWNTWCAAFIVNHCKNATQLVTYFWAVLYETTAIKGCINLHLVTPYFHLSHLQLIILSADWNKKYLGDQV